MKRLFLALALAASLSGCINGTDFDFLEVGVTTPDQLVYEFGESDTVINLEENKTSYIYIYSDSYHLAYTFEDGVLIYAESLRQKESGEWYSEPMNTK